MSDIKMSWPEAQHHVEYLARRIINYGPHPNKTGYVLVGRGGLAMGALLSRFLDMKYVFYLPIKKKELSTFPSWFRDTWASILKGVDVNTLFILDDINDTGETLHLILTLLQSHAGGKELIPVTLVRRSTSSLVGVLHAIQEKSHSWIVFPWEFEPIQEMEVPF